MLLIHISFINSLCDSYMQHLSIPLPALHSCLGLLLLLRLPDALWIYLGSKSTLIPLLPTFEASDLSQL